MPTRHRALDASQDQAAFGRYLRVGRRAAPLEFKYNHNHDPATGQFAAGSGIHLTVESAAMASRIADGFFLRTGKTIYVTSGTRSPERQAAAMVDKGTETWQSLYRDKGAVEQIRAAYDKAMKAGAGRDGAISAMSEVIREQEKAGRYISRHLQSHALDIRTSDLSPRNQLILEQEARRQGGKIISEGGREKHLHVQF